MRSKVGYVCADFDSDLYNRKPTNKREKQVMQMHKQAGAVSRLQLRKVAMAEAINAYFLCEPLSPEARRELIRRAGVKIGWGRAIKQVFAFAHGYINQWTRKGRRALTGAWLRLGETLFRLIYRFVRPRGEAPSSSLGDLVATFHRSPEIV